MQYSLLIYQGAEDFADRRDPQKHAEFYAAFVPYMKALEAAGIVVGGVGLQDPETATAVRLSQGEALVQDGPYADTKEQLGGFFLIEVPDLDTAISWAKKCPSRHDIVVEVRPCIPRME